MTKKQLFIESDFFKTTISNKKNFRIILNTDTSITKYELIDELCSNFNKKKRQYLTILFSGSDVNIFSNVEINKLEFGFSIPVINVGMAVDTSKLISNRISEILEYNFADENIVVIIDSVVLNLSGINSEAQLILKTLNKTRKILIINSTDKIKPTGFCVFESTITSKNIEHSNTLLNNSVDQKELIIKFLYYLDITIMDKLSIAESLNFLDEDILKLLTYEHDHGFDEYDFDFLNTSNKYKLFKVICRFDPFNGILLRKIYDKITDKLMFNQLELAEYILYIVTNNIQMIIDYKDNNPDVILLKDILEINETDVNKNSNILNLFQIFLNVFEVNKTFATVIGTYLFSELINIDEITKAEEVQQKILYVFNDKFGTKTQEILGHFKNVYNLKNSSGFDVKKYKVNLDEFLDNENLTIDNAKNEIIYFYISNYIGISLFENNINCDKYINTLKIYNFNINIDNSILAEITKPDYKLHFKDTSEHKGHNNHSRIYNNIALYKSKTDKQYALELFVSNIDITCNFHPILLNNLIGLLLYSSINNHTKKSLISSLYTMYLKQIVLKHESWYYNFFYVINGAIVNDFFKSNVLKITPVDDVMVAKQYDKTNLFIFFKYILDYYKKNDKVSVLKAREYISEMYDYDFPYDYIFIDYQEWSFI